MQKSVFCEISSLRRDDSTLPVWVENEAVNRVVVNKVVVGVSVDVRNVWLFKSNNLKAINNTSSKIAIHTNNSIPFFCIDGKIIFCISDIFDGYIECYFLFRLSNNVGEISDCE